MTVKRYTPTQCCEHDGTYVTYSDYQKLVAENLVLKAAFKPADIPSELTDVFGDTAVIEHDSTGDNQGHSVSWSWVGNQEDVIKAVLSVVASQCETPATDDAIAEIKSEEAQTMYESILDNPSVYDMESLVDYLESYAENKKSFAANLRAGRKA